MVTYFVGLPSPLTAYDKLIPHGYELLPVGQRHLTLLYLGSLRDPCPAARAVEELEG